MEELEKQNQECENEYKALDQKDCECEEELKKLRLEYKKILDRCEGDPLPLVTLLQEKIQQVGQALSTLPSVCAMILLKPE